MKKVKIVYSATFESEIDTDNDQVALVKAGMELEEFGINDQLTAYGAIVDITAVVIE